MTLHKTESFVPLTSAPASGERPDFRVTVAKTGESRPFQALEHKSAATAEGPARKVTKLCEPQVSVQRDGDRVTSVRIVCSCGQVMELACVYQEGLKAA